MNLLKVKEISHFPGNNFTPDLIKNVLFANTLNVLTEFYEMQSQFLINRYKMNSNMESSNIITLLTRQLHLEILRQKERNLNYNISLRNFIYANNYIRENFFLYNHGYKIVTISEKTGMIHKDDRQLYTIGKSYKSKLKDLGKVFSENQVDLCKFVSTFFELFRNPTINKKIK